MNNEHPGAHHLAPENIEALARDLEAVALGEAAVPAVDRDWITWAGVIAKVIRHLQGRVPEATGKIGTPSIASPDFNALLQAVIFSGATDNDEKHADSWSGLEMHINQQLAAAYAKGRADAVRDYISTRLAATAPVSAKFKLGDEVRKTKGSKWTGKVVGTYATSLTPEGYAVESSTEHGSVQIYPASALELINKE